MKVLCSDRFWLAKLALAAALFALLCHDARARIGPLQPSYARVSVYGEKLRGQTVSAQAYEVLGHAPDGFDLDSGAGPMRIVTAERPPVGETVSIVGRIAGNRRIEATRVQVNEGWRWKRPLNYAVSIATVLVFLWLARGRFRMRLAEGLFRSRC